MVKMGQNNECLQKYAPKHVFVRTQLRFNCLGPTIGMFPEKCGYNFQNELWARLLASKTLASKIRDFHPIHLLIAFEHLSH